LEQDIEISFGAYETIWRYLRINFFVPFKGYYQRKFQVRVKINKKELEFLLKINGFFSKRQNEKNSMIRGIWIFLF